MMKPLSGSDTAILLYIVCDPQKHRTSSKFGRSNLYALGLGELKSLLNRPDTDDLLYHRAELGLATRYTNSIRKKRVLRLLNKLYFN